MLAQRHERYGRASPPSSPPEPRGDRTSPPTRPGPPPGSCARWTLGRTSLWDGTRDQPPGGSRGVRILLDQTHPLADHPPRSMTPPRRWIRVTGRRTRRRPDPPRRPDPLLAPTNPPSRRWTRPVPTARSPRAPPRTSGGLGLGSPPPPMILRAAGTARTARCARRQPPVLRHDGSRPLEGGECRAAGLRSRRRPACPVRPPARRGQAVPPRARSDPPHPASTHPQGRSALLTVAAPANVACATPTTPRPATPAPLPGSGPACRCRKPRPRPPSRERPTETRSPAAPTSPRCPSR